MKKLFLFSFLFLGLISPAFCNAMDPSQEEGHVATDDAEDDQSGDTPTVEAPTVVEGTTTLVFRGETHNTFNQDQEGGQFYTAKEIRVQVNDSRGSTSHAYPTYDPVWQDDKKSLGEKIRHTATKHSTTSAAQGFGQAVGQNMGVILAQFIVGASKFAYKKTLKPVKVYFFGKDAPSLEDVITQANLTEKHANLVLAMQQTALSQDEAAGAMRQRETLAKLIESNGKKLEQYYCEEIKQEEEIEDAATGKASSAA